MEDQLRTLRRWLIVAGVWAVAASAIAAIALVTANDAKDKAEVDGTSSSAELKRADQRLAQRIEKLEESTRNLPTNAAVDALKADIAALEKQVGQSKEDAKAAAEKASDLEDRVQALEDASDTPDTDTTTTP